jgi:hypothetical protein
MCSNIPASHLVCRDGIYFDEILVSEYKLFKRSNKANLCIALVQQPVSQMKMTFQEIRKNCYWPLRGYSL